MTTAPEHPHPRLADAPVPAAGRAPVAAPAAGYVATLIALLLLGLGVVGLRDGAVSAGWLRGQEWTKSAIGWIDGLTFVWWMIPLGVALVLVGVWSLYAAVRPRRRTAVPITAKSGVWMAPDALARVASDAAASVPGVLDARSSATLRKLTVTVHTTADGDATDVQSAVTDAVRTATSIVDAPLKIRVRTRAGGA